MDGYLAIVYLPPTSITGGAMQIHGADERTSDLSATVAFEERAIIWGAAR